MTAARNAKRLSKEVEDIDGEAIRDTIDDLYGVITVKLGLKSLKIIALGKPVEKAAVMMSNIFKSIVRAYRSIEELSEIQQNPDFDPKPVF
jgi:hypothetical protein